MSAVRLDCELIVPPRQNAIAIIYLALALVQHSGHQRCQHAYLVQSVVTRRARSRRVQNVTVAHNGGQLVHQVVC